MVKSQMLSSEWLLEPQNSSIGYAGPQRSIHSGRVCVFKVSGQRPGNSTRPLQGLMAKDFRGVEHAWGLGFGVQGQCLGSRV